MEFLYIITHEVCVPSLITFSLSSPQGGHGTSFLSAIGSISLRKSRAKFLPPAAESQAGLSSISFKLEYINQLDVIQCLTEYSC
jgi:hypothetical protein